MPAQKIHATVSANKFTGEETQVLSAVNKMVNFIKPTLGPKIRHVLVDSGYKTELMDDGVSIAREFELEDEFEDAVCSYVKEISQRTEDKAGDGTTTTMVLLQALLANIVASGKSYPEIRTELDHAVLQAKEQLATRSKKVETQEDLLKVAKTSMNDDVAANLVAEVVWKVGSKGAVSITDYTGNGIEYTRLEGFVLNRGFIARGMITDKEKQIYEAPNKNFSGAVGVFIAEEVISLQEHIVPILQKAEENGIKNVLIFCNNLIGEAMGIVALNQSRAAFNIVAVPFPGQGEKTKDFIQDLRAVVGYADDRGYGLCDSVKVSKDDTTIVGGHGNREEIDALIKYLQEKTEETKDDYEKDHLHMRQARLAGGIVVVKVGGVTETETRLKLKKVEDAVNACKCALEEGISPGAGATLAAIKTNSDILNKSLESVWVTVHENSGVLVERTYGSVVGHIHSADETINLITGERGDFLTVGVVDATKVLRTALENAVSLATILFSLSGIITSKRDDNSQHKKH